MLSLRPARPDDAALILQFVRDLAEFEKLGHEAVLTEADVAEALFCAAPRAFCDIAEWDGRPAGFAVWFYNFSTFRGRHGIYLEDLFVRPEHRGRGIGKRLIRALLDHPELATVTSWKLTTRDAQTLYEGFGFVRMPEGRVMQLDRATR